jgi:hypothetical protein
LQPKILNNMNSVVLADHSLSGLISQIETYSFVGQCGGGLAGAGMTIELGLIYFALRRGKGFITASVGAVRRPPRRRRSSPPRP